jgi:hypothetical protein
MLCEDMQLWNSPVERRLQSRSRSRSRCAWQFSTCAVGIEWIPGVKGRQQNNVKTVLRCEAFDHKSGLRSLNINAAPANPCRNWALLDRNGGPCNVATCSEVLCLGVHCAFGVRELSCALRAAPGAWACALCTAHCTPWHQLLLFN